MGISRKTAQVRKEGLAKQIEAHLAKIEARPHSLDVEHWQHEVVSWIRQIQDLLPHVGRRTADAWQAEIDGWLARGLL